MQQTPTDREREREKELGTFSIMIFDSATYRFLALLIIKPYRKSTELKKKSFHISQKKRSKPFFCLEFSHVTNQQDIKSFVGQL